MIRVKRKLEVDLTLNPQSAAAENQGESSRNPPASTCGHALTYRSFNPQPQTN